MCKYPPTLLFCHFELIFGSFCGKMTESGVLDVRWGVARALPYSMFWADFMHGLLHSAYLSARPLLGARCPGTQNQRPDAHGFTNRCFMEADAPGSTPTLLTISVLAL